MPLKPVSPSHLEAALARLHIPNIGSATIRQIVTLSHMLEEEFGEPFVHLEMGNPGLPAVSIGLDTERRVLGNGIANIYPNINGIPQLKDAGARFLKAFLDIEVPPRCIVPTVGSMQATFTLFLLLGQRDAARRSILFLDPGFPAQHNQVKLLGLDAQSLDIHDCRGAALEDALEQILSHGLTTAIIYSNPNNPAWTNLTAQELEIIGRMATRHDVIVVEDLAYMGMDFRKYFGTPYQPPFVPTVAKYTTNCIQLVSASKIFSYAGQRIAIVAMSPQVADRTYPFFEAFYEMPSFGDAYIYGVLYCASSGTAHSPQYAMAEMLNAASDGSLDFVSLSQEYGRRSAVARKAFLDNGFHLVYAVDGDGETISDGFFFTVGYPGLSSNELQKELLRYGVSTISLPSTGSKQAGVRVCVSMLTSPEDFERLELRLSAFNSQHCK